MRNRTLISLAAAVAIGITPVAFAAEGHDSHHPTATVAVQEERDMEHRFGGDWRRYAATAPALSPARAPHAGPVRSKKKEKDSWITVLTTTANTTIMRSTPMAMAATPVMTSMPAIAWKCFAINFGSACY